MFSKFNYWIIRNLKEYRNTLIPVSMIEQYGIETIEERLSQILKSKVEIELKESSFIDRGKKFKDSNYIAEVKYE